MADGEVAEEPAVQQEHRTDIAGPDAAVTSDVSDSQSREEAPDGGNVPMEPDEDPAVGTTHLDNSTEHCHSDDAPTDAHSPAGSPAEGLTQAIPGTLTGPAPLKRGDIHCMHWIPKRRSLKATG